jgi:hypothetical protein
MQLHSLETSATSTRRRLAVLCRSLAAAGRQRAVWAAWSLTPLRRYASICSTEMWQRWPPAAPPYAPPCAATTGCGAGGLRGSLLSLGCTLFRCAVHV